MSPVKRYLLIFFAVYLGGGLVANILLGPPGYSRAYRAQYKAEHDRYLEIIKTKEYKLWKQRPSLHEIDPALSDFVAEYESREAFKSEQRRRAAYDNFFEFFIVVMVLHLAVHFGRKPLLDFLDAQVAEVRTKIERAAEARSTAAERKRGAQEKVALLPHEKEQTIHGTQERIVQEEARIEDLTRFTIEQVDRETEDRKREEEHAAIRLLKEELVDAAIERLVQRHKARISPGAEAAQIDQFIRDVEARS